MAEPIGVASGLLTLATFAFQSSRSPYQAIKHFQSLPQDHTEALNRVLLSLGQMAANSDTDLAALRFPLFRYGKAIEDFEGVIIKNIAYSGGPRSRCWDWAKLKYMRDDIVEFGNMQAGFESIISIVLADSAAAVIAVVLAEIKKMITNTISDLEDRSQENDRL